MKLAAPDFCLYRELGKPWNTQKLPNILFSEKTILQTISFVSGASELLHKEATSIKLQRMSTTIHAEFIPLKITFFLYSTTDKRISVYSLQEAWQDIASPADISILHILHCEQQNVFLLLVWNLFVHTLHRFCWYKLHRL